VQYSEFPEQNGTACCSDTAVSMHYIPPYMMWVLEYLLYHLRPVGARPDASPDTELVSTAGLVA
jgi:hypothetical protein